MAWPPRAFSPSPGKGIFPLFETACEIELNTVNPNIMGNPEDKNLFI